MRGEKVKTAAAPSCPLCGSVTVRVYCDAAEEGTLSREAFGSSRRLVSAGRILRCGDCGSGFRAAYSEQALADVYQNLDGTVYQAEIGGRRRTAQRHLAIVHRYVSGGRLLDVGCASGLFLDCAAHAGWCVTGVEPSRSLSEEARQMIKDQGEVHCASLQAAALPSGTFDAVTLWDVLEHVPDPLQFLGLCRRLLKPSGYLFANVPDLDSLPARLLGLRWPLLLPEHLTYFTRRSLTLCGARTGLATVRLARRPATFSLEYVCYRLAQHRLPGASLALPLLRRTALGRIMVAVPLGELYGVWQRAA